MRMLLGLVLCAALGGCGSFQNNSSKTTTVSGQSIGGGTDSKPVSCSGSGTMTVKWSGSAGTLTVSLSSGGSVVSGNDYTPTGAEQTATSTVAAGTYDLTVTRTSNWNGAYNVSISCP
jgi:hypothetical protein